MKKKKVQLELEDELDAEELMAIEESEAEEIDDNEGDDGEKDDEKGKKGLSRQEVALLRGKFDFDADRTVFVGNVPKDASSKEVSKLFTQFGQVDSVRFRSAVGRREKTPKRVAAIKRDEFHPEIDRINVFVKFKNAEDATKSLKLNNYVLREHHLRVDMCQQRGGQHGSSASRNNNNNGEHLHENCVFIGNLPFACSEEKLRAHFADCVAKNDNENGEKVSDGDGVVNVRIIRDRYSGLGKGFGYIQFANTKTVQEAIKTKDGSKFEGRKLRVSQSNAEMSEKVTEKKKKINKKEVKEKKQEKKLSKEQQAEKSMLRRKWFFKAGTSASAGKSSDQIAKHVKGQSSSRKEAGKLPQNAKKQRRPFHKHRKFRKTNAK